MGQRHAPPSKARAPRSRREAVEIFFTCGDVFGAQWHVWQGESPGDVVVRWRESRCDFGPPAVAHHRVYRWRLVSAFA